MKTYNFYVDEKTNLDFLRIETENAEKLAFIAVLPNSAVIFLKKEVRDYLTGSEVGKIKNFQILPTLGTAMLIYDRREKSCTTVSSSSFNLFYRTIIKKGELSMAIEAIESIIKVYKDKKESRDLIKVITFD